MSGEITPQNDNSVGLVRSSPKRRRSPVTNKRTTEIILTRVRLSYEFAHHARRNSRTRTSTEIRRSIFLLFYRDHTAKNNA